MDIILISNNPMVFEKYKGKTEFIYSEKYSYMDVLIKTRNKIHEGYELLTHPLSGSVKPNETPYKTVAISRKKEKLNIQSLQLIEESILTVKKFTNLKRIFWTQKINEDFQVIDYNLIYSAIDSMKLS